MICDRCRAEIEADPMPAQLDAALPIGAYVTRTIVKILWCNRGTWVAHERILAAVYAGVKEPPLSALSVLNVLESRLRRRFLPPGYRLETSYGGWRRLVVE